MEKTIQPGDFVSFRRGQLRDLETAEVVRVNRKTVTLKDPRHVGTTLRLPHHRVALVPPGAPTQAKLFDRREPVPDNVIVLPAHMCGQGRRVQFRGPGGCIMTGTIHKLGRTGAEVLDEQTQAYWHVRHEYIAPIEGELRARAEDDILMDIARCYARLRHYCRHVADAEGMTSALKIKLKHLYAEIGRHVEEEEAMAHVRARHQTP